MSSIVLYIREGTVADVREETKQLKSWKTKEGELKSEEVFLGYLVIVKGAFGDVIESFIVEKKPNFSIGAKVRVSIEIKGD